MQAKIIALGDVESGKTAIINRFVNDKFYTNQSIIQPAKYSKSVENRRKEQVTLNIWDLPADHEAAYYNYYNNADAFLLVIDCTKPFNVSQIQQQIRNVKAKKPEAKFYIAVNKWDRVYKEFPLHEDFKESSEDFNCSNEDFVVNKLKQVTKGFIELDIEDVFFCSAKDDYGINRMFHKIGANVVTNASKKENTKTEKEVEDVNVVKLTIIKRLNEYTSIWNKFIAGIKWLFSLGFLGVGFGLGMEKQAEAERLKLRVEDSDNLDALRGAIVESEAYNQKLVGAEYQKSIFNNKCVGKKTDKKLSSVEEVQDRLTYCRVNTTQVMNEETKKTEEKNEYIYLNQGRFAQTLQDCETTLSSISKKM